MYDIIFFTSNVGKGGLDIENMEEIEELRKYNSLLVLPFICIKNIHNIVENNKQIIYIDFINCEISLLKNLKLISNKLIYKYKGRTLNEDIVKLLSGTSKYTINILTTCINKDQYNIKFIKYWSLNFNKLKSITNINTIKYQEYFKDINDTNYFKFMYVGRSSYNKGIVQTVNAFKKYLQINNNCILILITIGNVYIDECKNIYNFINVDYNDCLYMIKNHCDCLIMASDNEGFGRVAIEALYYKKLLISTMNTMLFDLMPSNKGIYYLPSNDENIIYNALLNINKLEYDNNVTFKFICYLIDCFNNFNLYFK
jgi:glycosyltransferase involved in cell wall biosynthesis